VINLDSAKERFSLTRNDKIYQGQAIFSPGQINFEFQWLVVPGAGLKFAYSINRKSLAYTKTTRHSILGGDWEQQENTTKTPNPEFGKCLIMKTPPTVGNQI
jgi:hypothetical protein